MPSSTPRELKKLLVQEGFEVYRTLADRVVLAERVRDNLILDSGVAVVASVPQAVVVAVRVQANDFPSEDSEALFERARTLGETLAARGYAEIGRAEVPILDPGDRSRVLDTWYEVHFSLQVAETDSRKTELTFALEFDKIVAAPDSR
jgi:hypothetical protein